MISYLLTTTHYDLAQIYEQTGKTDDAVREYLKVEELFAMDPEQIAPLKEAFARSGAGGYWSRRLERYRESARSHYVSPGMVAAVCGRVGDKQCVFDWLEKGFEERDDLLINLKLVEPRRARLLVATASPLLFHFRITFQAATNPAPLTLAETDRLHTKR